MREMVWGGGLFVNKKYILFALALFACFGGFKDINAGEDGIYKLKPKATTEDLRKLVTEQGAQIVELDLQGYTRLNFDLDWSNCKKLKKINFFATQISDAGLRNILTNCKALEELHLNACSDLEFKNLDWSNCKKLQTLDLSSTKISDAGLQEILTNCEALEELDLSWNKLEFKNLDWSNCKKLKKLNLSECENLDEKYRNCYKTKEAIEQLKKDLGLENQKSLPINPKPSWLVAKWQALSTPWKWTLGIGAVAVPLIGACIFYKKQSIKNLSSAIWYRLAPLLKRQKTANQPLIVQNRYQI